MKGGVGAYSVLQKSVDWETGVEGKEYYCWRIPTTTKLEKLSVISRNARSTPYD